ncbi:MAG: AAA-like domain-containing protein, partial [Tolypothrix sp. T3-bin4]|nr:AAA-like domain-containing protein [Tolypothrix sp. T3-bin4]
MMGIEAVLAFADKITYTKTGGHLSDLQRVILRESWQETKKTYDQMAEEYGYSPNYIKQVVAPQLWKLLSQGLGEKVTKTNIRAVLERRMASQGDPNSPKSFATRVVLEYAHHERVKAPTTAINLPINGLVNVQLPESQTRALAATVHRLAHQPRPEIELEFPDGSVPLNSPFYVERIPHDSHCYQELSKPGALIRLKSPRQMGKTSLMNRILVRALQQDYKTALLDFQQAEETVLNDLNKLLRWFCASLTRQLKLEPKLDEYWDEDLGSKMSCTLYVQEHLLESITNPIVLALEEVSVLFEKAPIAQEFLTLLRSWHERAKVDPIWQKLRLVLVQSTEVYVPLDINQSPFNVGLGIELEPLTLQEIQDLAQRHGL